MTQTEIDELRRLNAEKTDEITRYAKKMAEIKGAIRVIRDRCDHIHPDGKTALSGGFMMKSCSICYWCDL